jgi:hypothetical protein
LRFGFLLPDPFQRSDGGCPFTVRQSVGVDVQIVTQDVIYLRQPVLDNCFFG